MSSPVITIFVRHAADCKYAGDEFAKRCQCRKHFRWTLNSKQYRRKANTRSWAEAEDNRQKLTDQLAGKQPEVKDNSILISEALETFKRDKAAQGLEPSSLLPYNLEMRRFLSFCESKGCHLVRLIDLPLLVDYRHTWTELYPSTTTRSLVHKRLNHFLRFCHNANWLDRVPKLTPVKINEPETLPLGLVDYMMLCASTGYLKLYEDRIKVHALIQLMRWSGLAIRDAANLRRDQLIKKNGVYRVTISRQKTGVNVTVPIPPNVADELLKVSAGQTFIFKTGTGSEASHARHMGQKISKVFEYAKIECQGHMVSHRLRDTFAVDLLEKGVSMDDVSKLLGHTSIKTTEIHYAKWSKGRQDRLDNAVTNSWGEVVQFNRL